MSIFHSDSKPSSRSRKYYFLLIPFSCSSSFFPRCFAFLLHTCISKERTGGYSRGSMDEDLAAIFKQTRRHCLESLFSIQHATKKHLAHGFEKLHNYDNQRPHENRGNKKSVTRFSRCFTRTRWLRMSWKVSRELTLLFIHAYILFAFRW